MKLTRLPPVRPPGALGVDQLFPLHLILDANGQRRGPELGGVDRMPVLENEDQGGSCRGGKSGVCLSMGLAESPRVFSSLRSLPSSPDLGTMIY